MLNVLWIVTHCKILCESQCSGSEIDVNCNKRNRCASWLYMPANDSLQSEHAYLSAEIYHIRPSLGKKKKKKRVSCPPGCSKNDQSGDLEKKIFFLKFLTDITECLEERKIVSGQQETTFYSKVALVRVFIDYFIKNTRLPFHTEKVLPIICVIKT